MIIERKGNLILCYVRITGLHLSYMSHLVAWSEGVMIFKRPLLGQKYSRRIFSYFDKTPGKIKKRYFEENFRFLVLSAQLNDHQILVTLKVLIRP
jgi:hypothetical protein